MAIGTTAAIIGASVIGAGTSAISGSRQASAARDAANVQADAANQNAAVSREIYYDQANRLEPFRQFGMSAINPLSDLLGLDYQTAGSTQNQAQLSTGQPTLGTNAGDYFNSNGLPFSGGSASGGFSPSEYLDANPSIRNSYSPGRDGFYNINDYATAHWQTHGQREGRPSGQPAPQGGALASFAGAATPTSQERTTTALEALQQRPGYQFRLGQGNDAYEASAAARGMTMSGAQQRALAEYNQNFASNEYDNEINRLLAVMGGGQVATNNTNAAAGQYGANVMNSNTNAANARASGYVNAGNASANTFNGVSGAIGQGLGMWGGYTNWGAGSPSSSVPSTPRTNNSYNI